MLAANSNVLVELGATEKSPARSPTRTYTPLEVASPSKTANLIQTTHHDENVVTIQAADPLLTSNIAPATGNEQVEVITIESSTVASTTEEVEPESPIIDILNESPPTPENPVSPILAGITMMNMDPPDNSTANTTNADPILPSDLQISSPKLTQFLLLSQQGTSTRQGAKKPEFPTDLEEGDFDITMDTTPIENQGDDQPGPSVPNISLTRNELLVISNVLGRVPTSFLGEENTLTGPEISVSVVDNPPNPPQRVNPSMENNLPGDSYVYQEQTETDLNDEPVVRNKRQRPRYSLKGSMLRKHPVLNFSATRPIDREKTPHKWWCRVCRLELSLMSRGVLEVLAHYKTDSHLVREHRIRMDTPGMPLYDKNGHELQGIALSEAKKVAKETYPIVPQLDSYRLLVGQDSLPKFGAEKSPMETVISQICLLEIGLRRGGDLSCLSDIFEEVNRFSSEGGPTVAFDWSPHRLFVSIFRI